MNSLTAVFRAPGAPLELTLLPLPELRAGEVLVKVTCCTLCGSDLHTVSGRRSLAGPTILGHEIVGVVAGLKDSGMPHRDLHDRPLVLGDRITWSIAASCRRCFYCQNGLPQKCEKLFKYGHETVGGRCSLSGGLSQYCHLVEGTAIIKLPSELPDVIACPANCATATVAAAIRSGGDLKGKCVVVHGAGMLGLTAAAMSKEKGAAHVVVTDIVPARLNLASQFGASDTLLANDELAVEKTVHGRTNGRGADVVFELSGSPQVCERSIHQLRVGGRLILIGSVFPTRPVSIAPERLVRRLIRIEGIHNYTPEDLVEAIRFLTQAQNSYAFDTLIGAEYPLAEVNQAIAEALQSKSFRIAVRPNQAPPDADANQITESSSQSP